MNKFLEKLKNIRSRQLLYPSMVGVLVAIIVAVFVLSARYLSTNIDKALVADEKSVEAELVKVDLDGYYAVAKRVGISVSELAPPEATPPTPAPPPTPTSTPLTASEKSALKIEVLNSTGAKGLAPILAALFREAGFTVAKTGAATPSEPQTLIKIKQFKRTAELETEITAIVSKKYSPASVQTLEEASSYDVVVVIGLH